MPTKKKDTSNVIIAVAMIATAGYVINKANQLRIEHPDFLKNTKNYLLAKAASYGIVDYIVRPTKEVILSQIYEYYRIIVDVFTKSQMKNLPLELLRDIVISIVDPDYDFPIAPTSLGIRRRRNSLTLITDDTMNESKQKGVLVEIILSTRNTSHKNISKTPKVSVDNLSTVENVRLHQFKNMVRDVLVYDQLLNLSIDILRENYSDIFNKQANKDDTKEKMARAIIKRRLHLVIPSHTIPTAPSPSPIVQKTAGKKFKHWPGPTGKKTE